MTFKQGDALTAYIEQLRADNERLRNDYSILKRDYDALREVRENEGNEIERLRAENKEFRVQVVALLEGAQDDEAEIERLRDLVIVAQPEMERIEFAEASSDDGCGTRLITLRQWLTNARRALEQLDAP